MSSALEDLLNDEESSDEENAISSATARLDLKQLNIDELLSMNEDDEDDPAVLSSTIYEQFSQLMKTNEKIQRELATSSSPTSSPRVSSEIKKISLSVRKGDETEDLAETGLPSIGSSDILRSLMDNDEDDTEDNTPRGFSPPSAPSELGLIALKAIEAKELKSLQYGEQTSVSALQIRRSTANSAGSVAASATLGSTGAAVMTGIEELSLVTNQLKKNASYQQHGPGTATAIALCSKFVAVGTVKGFILIFDHHQEIRKVLTHPNPIKPTAAQLTAQNNPMSISGLDCLVDGSMIVAGHTMGEVLFWDCVKGVVLKQIKDPSNAEILKTRFIYPIASVEPRHTFSLHESDVFHAVVLTGSSVVNRYKLSKSLLSTWVAEVDCLLDESSGRVVSFSVLDPFSFVEDTIGTAASPSTSSHGNQEVQISAAAASLSRFYSDLRQQRGVVQIFSFGFATQTCIVQSSPEVRILFKWANPNYANYESKDSTESLDWTWMRTPFDLTSTATSRSVERQPQEGMICSVLARARESSIDLMVLRVKRTTSSQAAVNDSSAISSLPSGGTRGSGGRASILMMMGSALTGGSSYQTPEDIPSLSFECVPWINRTIPNQQDHILSIKWIKSTQLVLFTKNEVLLLDAALNVLEKCLLLPAISTAFIATFDQRNNVTAEVKPEIRTLGGEGYVLTATSCFKLFTKSPFEQANSLINSGRWLEGLSLIVENISKSPTLLELEAEHIRRYIINYTLLAVKRSTSSLPSEDRNNGGGGIVGGKAPRLPSSKHSRNHYRLVASVCTEYCVATRQFDLLFHEILDVFRTESEQDLLLESLEPFILNQSIEIIPLMILLEFFQMGVSQQKLSVIERCLIAFHPRKLFSSDLTLEQKEMHRDSEEFKLRGRLFAELYTHQLWSSFLYLDSIGADGHCHAFQMMFQFLLACYGDSLLPSERPVSAALDSFEDRETKNDSFYKLLLFLLHIFEGKVFPKAVPNNSFFPSEDISFPFPSPTSPNTQWRDSTIQLEEEKSTENADNSSSVANLVNGFQVNAVWSLLQLITIDEMPAFVLLPVDDLSMLASSPRSKKFLTKEDYDLHSLREVEFPLLHFFSRFDHTTLFHVLVKGVEGLISLFCSGQQTTAASTSVLPSSPGPIVSSGTTTGAFISAHNHLIIGTATVGTKASVVLDSDEVVRKRERIFVTRDVITLSTKQRNESKIMALLQNIFLYVKEEKERSHNSRLLDDYFLFFSPLFTRLSNATIANDLLHELIRHRASQAKRGEFSLLRCEEQLRSLIENQIKLLLSSSAAPQTSGSVGSAKFNAFSDKLVRILQEQGFYWTSFLVKKYHVKLFSTHSPPVAVVSKRPTHAVSILHSEPDKPNTPNEFLPQLKSYLDLIKARKEEATTSTVGVSKSSPLLPYTNLLTRNTPSSVSAHRMSLFLEGGGPTVGGTSALEPKTPSPEDAEAANVLFKFVAESLEYFEREKSLLLATPASSPLSTSSSKHKDFSSSAPHSVAVGSDKGTTWSLPVIEELLGRFREAVIDVMSDLFDLSIDQTIQMIILPFFLSPSSIHLIMESSRRTPHLQFKAFHRLIVALFEDHEQNNSSTFHIKQYFQNTDLLYFLRLHCSFAPETILSFLKSYIFLPLPSAGSAGLSSGVVNSRGSDIMIHQESIEAPLPLDEMADILREFPHIFDGIAFFEEKFGNVEEALTILLRDFSNKLKAMRKEIDSSLRMETTLPSASSHRNSTVAANPATVQLLLHVRASISSSFVTSHSRGSKSATKKSAVSPSVTQNQLQQLMVDLSNQIQSCRLLRYSLTCITELCERQSPKNALSGAEKASSSLERTSFNEELAEKLWKKSFEHLLNERQLMKESLIVSSSSQITAQFLTFLIQEFMNAMKVFISPQDIITQVLNQTATTASTGPGKHSIVLGELSEIMSTMLQSNAAELLLYENMKRILFGDVKTIHQRKIRKKRAFVFRSDALEGGSAVADSSEETKDDLVERSPSDGPTASQKYLERKAMASRSKPFRLRDMKNITHRAQEKLHSSLPRVSVPANISDFGAMDFEVRKPGQLERTARFSVRIDAPVPWQ